MKNSHDPLSKDFESHLTFLSHYHHFKWWFELALIRAGYMLAQKGGYRKHCYWSAIKRYFLNLLFLTLLPALLYISLLPLL